MIGVLKKKVNDTLNLNKLIFKKNLSKINFGNASILDRKKSIIYIKGTGFELENLKSTNISICKFNYKNEIVEQNSIKPSVDVYTHLYLYNKYKNINTIIHTHSKYATILAQLEIEPECFGTTHADFFKNKIPLSKKIKNVNKKQYEIQIGETIFQKIKNNYDTIPGILVCNHGCYVWGKDSSTAIYNAEAIELICELYYYSKLISKKSKISKNLMNFHFNRKHGPKKYYGQ